ncbi:MAG: hypothetical protein ABJN75_23770 [Hoeflea sp.]|uniref:hypothetical protein n=1 Tax=Hoeflea sp. TaxID=1940281 RepID=UPI003297ACBC
MENTGQTRVHYMYRDASNWKFWGAAIVDGELSLEQLQPYLFDNDFFVPHEVGLDHLLDQPMNEDDHYLHSFVDFESVSGQEPLCSVEEFVDRFRTAHERGWFSKLI